MRRAALIFAVTLVTALACQNAYGAWTRAPGGPVVRSIKIVGNAHLSASKIKATMRTKESKMLRKRHLRESTLESDLIAIEAFYGKQGFLAATAEVADKRFDKDRSNVWITIQITEGQQTIVREVLLEGNKYVATDALRRLLQVKAGQPLDEKLVGEDEYSIYAYYADRGFVFASVSHEIGGAPEAATVTYSIREREPASIAGISVAGNTRVNDRIVKREVTLKRGDIFSRKKVLDSQQHLYDTGFFKDVTIEPAQASGDSASVDLSVRVKERKIREASAGLGYGTRDEARMTLGWIHRNIFNTGRQLEIRTILASQDLTKGLTHKRGDVSLTDRWLFGRRLVGVASIYFDESLQDFKEVPGGQYTLDRVGLNLGVQKDLSRSTKLTLAYTHELADIRNPTWHVEDPEALRVKVGQEVNRSASLQLERDTRTPFFDPHGGSLTRLIAKTAGGIFGGDNSYNKYTLSWGRYLALGKPTVLALGVKAGQAEAFGASASKGVPDYERFYVGGSSTVRGYDERAFGPGNFFLVGNVEVRYSLVWKLTSIAFFDMGNAWSSARKVRWRDFDLHVPAAEYEARRATDVKYSTGLGFGIETPVGPVRFDYGIRLKRGITAEHKREALGMIHFTIGHAF
ncbi:MAG TPA: outer membrane protein assembly factor BamA [bacterium]|nr:outer membrane protein assembly factor BamA [bacterium]